MITSPGCDQKIYKSLNNRASYFQRKIISWGKNNFANYPWRHATNDWHNLVAEIMLQRTRADQVLPVYEKFCREYSSPGQYLRKEDFGVFNSLGLNWRGQLLRELAAIIEHEPIPLNREKLLKLPGVGPYIASAYLSLHKNKREHIIDSNVVRLYGRFFGFQTNSESRRLKALHDIADILTPKRSFKAYNYGLIDFTRAICRPRPECGECIIHKRCTYKANENLDDE